MSNVSTPDHRSRAPVELSNRCSSWQVHGNPSVSLLSPRFSACPTYELDWRISTQQVGKQGLRVQAPHRIRCPSLAEESPMAGFHGKSPQGAQEACIPWRCVRSCKLQGLQSLARAWESRLCQVERADSPRSQTWVQRRNRYRLPHLPPLWVGSASSSCFFCMQRLRVRRGQLHRAHLRRRLQSRLPLSRRMLLVVKVAAEGLNNPTRKEEEAAVAGNLAATVAAMAAVEEAVEEATKMHPRSKTIPGSRYPSK